jgi:hypothetical protein
VLFNHGVNVGSPIIQSTAPMKTDDTDDSCDGMGAVMWIIAACFLALMIALVALCW